MTTPTDNSTPSDGLKRWVQVTEEHYDVRSYLHPGRMASVGYQVRMADALVQNAELLEVGVGAGITAALLQRMGHRVSTLDVDRKLSPTLSGSVTAIPAPDKSFDVFVCCQVLEHLPWTDAQQALQELQRVSRTGGVISVPSMNSFVGIRLHPLTRGVRTAVLPAWFPWPKQMHCKLQHHWELGAGLSLRVFRQAVREAGFSIVQEVRPIENPYHHFFSVRCNTQ